MAAPTKISREDVLGAALELVRTQGEAALNARALARSLGCSTQPVFRHFASMEEVRQAVLVQAHDVYLDFVREWMAGSEYPAYKASGMGYIEFARTQPWLFRLLFMRSRELSEPGPEAADWQPFLALAGRSAGIDPASVELFHLEMWTLVHGIAVMLATGYLELDRETVSRMLTDAYLGIKTRWEEKQ